MLICNTGMARSDTQPRNERDCPAEINPSQATLPRSASLGPIRTCASHGKRLLALPSWFIMSFSINSNPRSPLLAWRR